MMFGRTRRQRELDRQIAAAKRKKSQVDAGQGRYGLSPTHQRMESDFLADQIRRMEAERRAV